MQLNYDFVTKSRANLTFIFPEKDQRTISTSQGRKYKYRKRRIKG